MKRCRHCLKKAGYILELKAYACFNEKCDVYCDIDEPIIILKS